MCMVHGPPIKKTDEKKNLTPMKNWKPTPTPAYGHVPIIAAYAGYWTRGSAYYVSTQKGGPGGSSFGPNPNKPTVVCQGGGGGKTPWTPLGPLLYYIYLTEMADDVPNAPFEVLPIGVGERP